MSEARYNVVVSGAIIEGFELEQVKAEFSKLFSVAEARTDKIFTKGNITIKKDVAETTAQKFIKALERIGAAAHLHPLETDFLPEPEPEPPKGLQLEPLEKPKDYDSEDSSAVPNDSKSIDNAAAISQSQNNTGTVVASPSPVQPFSFLGNGNEYFRIWIVNILLTIVTLGIYSAWAKVRNAQYFYGHTEMTGSRFGYHAKPLTILKGRIIAVILFVIYTALQNLFPAGALVMMALLIIALPWIAIRSLRFNRRMSAWRNIRFGFDGTIWPAIQVFILWPLVGIISLGILMPYAMYKQNEFIVNNTRYGTSRFTLEPCGKEFFMIFVGAFVIMLLAGLVGWGLALVLPPLSLLVYFAAYLYMFVFISVRSANLIFNNSILNAGQFCFDSSWTDGSYMKVLLINSLFTLLTLGFYYPWAMVRVANYKAEHLSLIAHEDLDSFVAREEEHVSALGEEMGDVFDMEIGL